MLNIEHNVSYYNGFVNLLVGRLKNLSYEITCFL